MAENERPVEAVGLPEEATDSHSKPNEPQGVKLIGGVIEKEFEGEIYKGKITSYDAANKWYRVRYADNDEEDMNIKEILPLLVEPRGGPTRGTNLTASVGKGAEIPGDEGGTSARVQGSDSDWVRVANPAWLGNSWQRLQRTGESGKKDEVVTVRIRE